MFPEYLARTYWVMTRYMTINIKRKMQINVTVKKIMCTLVQALRLCTGRTAHRGSRDIALLFLDHSTRRRWGVSLTPRLPFTPGKDPVHIVQEAGRAPGPVWTGAENLSSTGIRSPDRPTRSHSLYRLSYRAPDKNYADLNYELLILQSWIFKFIVFRWSETFNLRQDCTSDLVGLSNRIFRRTIIIISNMDVSHYSRNLERIALVDITG